MASRKLAAPLLLTLCLLAPLAGHALLGSYSRLLADDYCSAAIARARGVLAGTLYWYETWTGRYAANFLDALAGATGVRAVAIGPGLALVLWLPLLAAAVAALTPRPAQLRIAAPLAAGIIFATLSVTPTVAQSLYWGQGMRSIVPPLILLPAYIALLGIASRPLPALVRILTWAAGAAVVLLAAGFNETYTAVQIAILGGALVLAWAAGPAARSALVPGLAAGLAAALAGLALMVTAPGNAFRQAYFPPPPALPALLAIAGRNLAAFLANHVLLDLSALLSLAGVLALDAWAGAQSPARDATSRRRRLALRALPAAALVLIFLCFVPAAYGMSSRPLPRTLLIPAYLLACAAAAQGYLLGRGMPSAAGRKPIAQALVGAGLVALAALALWSAVDLLRQAPAFNTYAAAWDATDAHLRAARAAGETAVAVPIVPNPLGLEDISPDAGHWINYCVGDYYDLAVTAAP